MSTEAHKPFLRFARPPIKDGDKVLCPKCERPLLKARYKEYEDFGRCPKCRGWYYLNYVSRRRIPYKSIKPQYIRTAERFLNRLEIWLERFLTEEDEEPPSEVRIWTSDEYDQEFLRSLIPKR